MEKIRDLVTVCKNRLRGCKNWKNGFNEESEICQQCLSLESFRKGEKLLLRLLGEEGLTDADVIVVAVDDEEKIITVSNSYKMTIKRIQRCKKDWATVTVNGKNRKHLLLKIGEADMKNRTVRLHVISPNEILVELEEEDDPVQFFLEENLHPAYC